MRKLTPVKNKKRIPIILKNQRIVLLLIIFLVIILGVFVILKDIYSAVYTPKGSGSTLPKVKDVYSILVLGYAGGTHDGPFLTDTMMIVRIDLKQKKILLVSIPRDLWVKLPTKSGNDLHTKVNTIYQRELFIKEDSDIDPKYLGSKQDAEFAKHIISEISGIPIDNYAAIDFAGFTRAIDLLGGVDVQVPKTFDDPEYPLDGKENDLCGKSEEDIPEFEKIATKSASSAYPCRYEILHFDAGKNHMDGSRALKFVRSRHSKEDGTDFGRAERQQLLLEGIRDKVLSVAFIPKIIPFITEMTKYIKTDLELSTLNTFMYEAKNENQYIFTSLIPTDKNFVNVSTSDDGQYILIPKSGMDNWTSVINGVKQTIEAIPSPQLSIQSSPTGR